MLPFKDYSIKSTVIAGIPVVLATYRVGDTYHCVVADRRPGANVMRSQGSTPHAALLAATQQAKRRFIGS